MSAYVSRDQIIRECMSSAGGMARTRRGAAESIGAPAALVNTTECHLISASRYGGGTARRGRHRASRGTAAIRNRASGAVSYSC
jgi:hypothetical protein